MYTRSSVDRSYDNPVEILIQEFEWPTVKDMIKNETATIYLHLLQGISIWLHLLILHT